MAWTEQTQKIVRGAHEIVVRCGVLKVHGVAHAETKTGRHRPRTFSMDNRARADFILCDDVIDRAGIPGIARGENTARLSETELDKVDVVNVQVEEGTARGVSLGKM